MAKSSEQQLRRFKYKLQYTLRFRKDCKLHNNWLSNAGRNKWRTRSKLICTSKWHANTKINQSSNSHRILVILSQKYTNNSKISDLNRRFSNNRHIIKCLKVTTNSNRQDSIANNRLKISPASITLKTRRISYRHKMKINRAIHCKTKIILIGELLRITLI